MKILTKDIILSNPLQSGFYIHRIMLSFESNHNLGHGIILMNKMLQINLVELL